MPKNKRNDTGSQSSSEPAFLILGKLRRAHGVRGEIPLELYTKMLELLSPEREVYIGETHQPFTIETTRWKQELLLLKFKEIGDRSVVSQFTNELVYIKTSQLPSLTGDDFYTHELLGLDVYEDGGSFLGVLMDVLETGANDVYLIQNDDGDEILIPAVDEMMLEIDFDQKKIIVARMEWYGEGE